VKFSLKQSQEIASISQGFGLGTPVLLGNGKIEVVENLRTGDFVMGPDSKPRRVVETFKQRAALCKVVPVKGDPWVCAISTAFTTADQFGNMRDVSAEYLLSSWSGNSSRSCRLFRRGVDFVTAEQPFDPYLIGLWIGDGARSGARITTADPEIVNYLQQTAASLGLHCYSCIKPKDRHRVFPPRTIALAVDGHGKGQPRDGRNALRAFFRSQCVIGESKSIPSMYLIADRQQRLALLAGIIDTDGYYDKPRSNKWDGMYEISTVFPVLRDQILYLARSLGLAANSNESLKGNQTPGFVGRYHRLAIRGDLHEIPCLLPRKCALPRCGSRRTDLTGFSLEQVEDGDCFGLKLDRDGHFLMGDFTVTYAGPMLQRRVVRSEVRLRAYGKAAV
jgi:replicative DNA helicase